MISRLPIYTEAGAGELVDAWLERDGERLPLQRVLAEIEPVDVGAPDERPLAPIAQISVAAARLPSLETRKAIAAADAAFAAVRAALPAMGAAAKVGQIAGVIGNCARVELGPVSTMTPAKAAQFLRDVPHLSPADQAAFDAAARDLPKAPK